MEATVVSAHNPMTGPRHLGHYVSTMIDWFKLQKDHELFVIIDDLIATLLYPNARKSITDKSFEVAKEFLATGVDFHKNSLVLTSMIPEAFELAFFAGQTISEPWCIKLYEESFAGLLDTYQRQQLGLPKLASAAEVVYPQIHLAALTLGLKATALQGGEEMRGYMEIMEEIASVLGKHTGIKAPSYLPGQCTFLVGTDGIHMATGNAVYISESPSDMAKSVGRVRTTGIFELWAEALGRKELKDKLAQVGNLNEDTKIMTDALSREFAPYRDSRITKQEISAIFERSAIKARERVRATLVQVKGVFGVPGFHA